MKTKTNPNTNSTKITNPRPVKTIQKNTKDISKTIPINKPRKSKFC